MCLVSWFSVAFVLTSLARTQVDSLQLCSTEGLTNKAGAYYLVDDTTARSYEESRTFCRHLDGGDLPVIQNAVQQNDLQGLLPAPSGANLCYWFGLRRRESSTPFTWIDGTNLGDFDKFNVMPDNISSNQCGCMVASNTEEHGDWRSVDCDLSKRHICRVPEENVNCTWHRFGNSMYLIEGNNERFEKAREICQDHGGDLAVIKSSEVNMFLTSLLPRPTSASLERCVWFGLFAPSSEEFQWADDTLLGQVPDNGIWEANRPSLNVNSDRGVCLLTSFNVSLHGRWRDVSIATRQPYVCENVIEQTDCPWGFYGTNCKEVCNCSNNGPCEKETGQCIATNGTCGPGFMNDYNGLRDNCDIQSGCYAYCTKTCHCAEGRDDCNSVTGTCASGRCHRRWTGDTCQKDRFNIMSLKANPGTARIMCGFDATNSNYAIINTYLVSGVMESRVQNVPRENSTGHWLFVVDNIDDDEVIYCVVITSAQSLYARVLGRQFYQLPVLTSAVNVSDIGPNHIVLRWNEWNELTDTGDGPVIGYFLYVSDIRKEWINGSTSTDTPLTSLTREFNITGLEPATNYNLSLAAVREGAKGEGPTGPALEVSTNPLPTTPLPTNTLSTNSAVTQSSPTTPGILMNNDLIAAGIGGGVGAAVFILVIVIVIVVILRRRKRHHDNHKHDALLSLKDMASSKKDDPTGLTDVRTSPLADIQRSASETSRSPTSARSPPHRAPMPTAEFINFVQTNRHTGFFKDEFFDLPKEDIHPQTSAREEVNFNKNRYKNVLPYDSTRVKLAVQNGDKGSDYFNASFISSFEREKAYIASQGPNKVSVTDFWRMIWQENVQTIAMVTRLKEGDKVKCIRYWPRDTKDSPAYGDIRLSMTSEDTFSYWTKRSLIVIKGNQTRTLTQFHFTSWPDKDVPKHKSQLLRFIKEVQGHHGSSSSPLLIHCSAGVGRTGVVIGIDSIVSRAKQTGMVEVFNFVASMREKRPHMVQTPEQYAFLYEAVLEDLLWEDTEIPLSQFVERIRELQEIPAEGATNRSLLARQFENLQILCPEPPETDVRSGKMAENQPKNRYGNLLPLQRNRVMLNDPDEDYINASFVQGAHYSFITTQMPLPNTVTAFLSMLLTYTPTCVIMLNDIDESCAKYWPDEDQDAVSFGSYAVSTLDETEYDDMVVRTINVQSTSSEVNHVVRQFQFRGWPTDMRAQATTGRREAEDALLRLIGDAKRQSEVDGNLPLLVHCLSGVGRTGAFCVTMECLAQVSEGTTVDVFHTVKMLRADRTHFVQTEEEYAFIHDVVAGYLRAIDYEPSGSPETTSDEPFYGNVAAGYSGGGPEAAPSPSEWPEVHPPPPAQNTIYQNVEIAEV